jgi:raffinose/stachyose/melibiose transport system substrate-binding protein
MRVGGDHALADAKAGKDGGFKSATFVQAGKLLRELGALEPFQAGYLQTSHAQSAGIFGDGKAAMDLMGQWLLGMQAPNSASGKGLPEEDIGILSFPVVAGGKGKATDTLGGINGWLVSNSAPAEAADFLNFFSQEKYAKEAAATGAYIPVVKGANAAITDPLFKRLADDLAATTWHQNYFDQDLGPSVGRVINDVSVSVAAGEMTPEAAAAAIQEAAEQQ